MVREERLRLKQRVQHEKRAERMSGHAAADRIERKAPCKLGPEPRGKKGKEGVGPAAGRLVRL